jgi:hypothetical protein
MKHTIALLGVLAGLQFAVPVHGEIDFIGRDAPPELVARAKVLIEKNDYQGVDALVAEIDAKYGSDHNEEYFRCLNGVMATLGDFQYVDSPEWPRIWAERKMRWKILLTPYSRIEEAWGIQKMKDLASRIISPPPFRNYEHGRNQFVALRNDAVALMLAYGDSLRARIIPNYAWRPEGGFMSIIIGDPKKAAEFEAKLEKEKPQMMRNKYANAEQRALIDSLSLLGDWAIELVKHDFAYPPEDDDETVRLLLDSIPSNQEPRERILLELAGARRARTWEIKEADMKRKLEEKKAH